MRAFAARAHSRCAAALRLNSLPSIALRSGNRNPFLICFSAGIHALAHPARPLRQRRLESTNWRISSLSQTPPLPISLSFSPACFVPALVRGSRAACRCAVFAYGHPCPTAKMASCHRGHQSGDHPCSPCASLSLVSLLVPTQPSTHERSSLLHEHKLKPWLRLGHDHSQTGLFSRRC